MTEVRTIEGFFDGGGDLVLIADDDAGLSSLENEMPGNRNKFGDEGLVANALPVPTRWDRIVNSDWFGAAALSLLSGSLGFMIA